MIDINFQPPEPAISQIETEKRKNLLPWVLEYFNNVTTGIFVCGSLSYGADYSVTSTSDIDIQLVLNDDTLDIFESLDLYDKTELHSAIKGYKKGAYKQFSLTGIKDGVPIESHFWNKQAFIDAITFQSSETQRLRSSIDTPSTDYGFAFDGTYNSLDFYGEIIDGYPVSVFPSYREVEGKLYLCRPVTNMLGGPIVLKTDAECDIAIDACWTETITRLKDVKRTSPDVQLSIVNALPSQYKMSPTSKATVIAKTEHLLSL